MIDHFTGEYDFLSNFFVLPNAISHDGILYPTTEHAFQAAKSLEFRQRWEISKLDKPWQAKKAGKDLQLRPDWGQAKYHVMYELLTLKFVMNPELRGKLLDTYPERLVEGNNWHDQIWGKCECPRHQGQGENRLGQLLELVRQQLLR